MRVKVAGGFFSWLLFSSRAVCGDQPRIHEFIPKTGYVSVDTIGKLWVESLKLDSLVGAVDLIEGFVPAYQGGPFVWTDTHPGCDSSFKRGF